MASCSTPITLRTPRPDPRHAASPRAAYRVCHARLQHHLPPHPLLPRPISTSISQQKESPRREPRGVGLCQGRRRDAWPRPCRQRTRAPRWVRPGGGGFLREPLRRRVRSDLLAALALARPRLLLSAWHGPSCGRLGTKTVQRNAYVYVHDQSWSGFKKPVNKGGCSVDHGA